MINSVYPLTMACPPTADDRAGSWPGAGVARAFARAVESGRLNLPLPGGGRTRKRWAVLAQLGEEDLCLARLAEGHADALAILAELGAVTTPPPGSRWGVWAAQPPGPGLTASKTAGGWRLDGTKQYCSGARSVTDALVTATAPDGSRLFAVSTRDLSLVPGTWPATGMAASDTLNVDFTDIPAEPVGSPGCRAPGAGPLSHDEAHGRRVADLTVYLRQHHAERDLAELGALVADSDTAW
jgi:alkylation response protein AidB-like acyl-CoA dehydrogenase